MLDITCTVSEILAEIDHKGPNWTFLTLKMTFISKLENDLFHTFHIYKIGFTTKKLHNALNLGSTLLLLNNINN